MDLNIFRTNLFQRNILNKTVKQVQVRRATAFNNRTLAAMHSNSTFVTFPVLTAQREDVKVKREENEAAENAV